MMMKVSVGVVAYNEEQNLHDLLLKIDNQTQIKYNIDELFIISDGSTDSTNKIIEKFKSKKFKVIKIIHKKRKGKYKRVNEFIKKAKCPYLILLSADIMIQNNSFDLLAGHIKNNIGAVTSRCIPKNSKFGIINNLIHIHYDLFHILSSMQPKGNELTLFKKEDIFLDPTTVDEEFIISVIEKKGYRVVYAQDVLYNNYGPSTLPDFLSQIRRNYSGHIYLKEKGHKTITNSTQACLLSLLKYLLSNPNKLHLLLLYANIQFLGRFLGIYDAYRNYNNPLWKIAKSTKKSFYNS